ESWRFWGQVRIEMMRLMQSGRFRWMCVVTLSWMFAYRPADALGQQGPPSVPPITDPPRAVAPSSDAYLELLDRLGKMEQRLDWVTKQNEDLARANKTLAEKGRDLSREITNPGRQGGMTGDIAG